jgi:hypothetical protein
MQNKATVLDDSASAGSTGIEPGETIESMVIGNPPFVGPEMLRAGEL